MGINNSKLNVLIIGLCNSGKTHFLDMLVYCGDTTRRPTFGVYEASYKFNGVRLEFIEYGGSLYDKWELMTFATTSDALYVFVDPHETELRLVQLHSCMLIQILKMPKQVPICIILNGEGANRKEIIAHFQLRDLTRNGWPVRIVTLTNNLQEWGNVVQTMFEWTIANAV